MPRQCVRVQSRSVYNAGERARAGNRVASLAQGFNVALDRFPDRVERLAGRRAARHAPGQIGYIRAVTAVIGLFNDHRVIHESTLPHKSRLTQNRPQCSRGNIVPQLPAAGNGDEPLFLRMAIVHMAPRRSDVLPSIIFNHALEVAVFQPSGPRNSNRSPHSYIRNTPTRRGGSGACSDAARASPRTMRVSAGSITPSSHSRAVL